MPVRDGVDQALALWSPPVAPRHVGGDPALVQENEAGRLHEPLPHLPAAAVPRHVGPILLSSSQGFFYMTP